MHDMPVTPKEAFWFMVHAAEHAWHQKDYPLNVRTKAALTLNILVLELAKGAQEQSNVGKGAKAA